MWSENPLCNSHTQWQALLLVGWVWHPLQTRRLKLCWSSSARQAAKFLSSVYCVGQNIWTSLGFGQGINLDWIRYQIWLFKRKCHQCKFFNTDYFDRLCTVIKVNCGKLTKSEAGVYIKTSWHDNYCFQICYNRTYLRHLPCGVSVNLMTGIHTLVTSLTLSGLWTHPKNLSPHSIPLQLYHRTTHSCN